MISVIINTKDRLRDLKNCLKSMIVQKCPISEIIVVDASSNHEDVRKESYEILKSFKGVFKCIHTKPGSAYQRNIGIDNTNPRSDFVCFFDDDVILFEDTIGNFLKVFNKYDDLSMVQGVETNRKPQNQLGKMVRKIFLIGYESNAWRLLPSGENTYVIKPKTDIFVGSIMTGFICIRRKVLDQFRFDEWFAGYSLLEDFDFSLRLGKKFKMLQSPAVKFIHNKSEISRLNSYKTYKMLIINKMYVFKKNMKKTIINEAAFWWSIFGYVVLSFGKSIYKKDAGFLLGTLAGCISLCWGRKR